MLPYKHCIQPCCLPIPNVMIKRYEKQSAIKKRIFVELSVAFLSFNHEKKSYFHPQSNLGIAWVKGSFGSHRAVSLQSIKSRLSFDEGVGVEGTVDARVESVEFTLVKGGLGADMLGVELLECLRGEKEGGAGSWGMESWMPESPCVGVGRITFIFIGQS